MEKKLSPPPTPPKVDISVGFKLTWDYNSVNVNIGLQDHVRAEETTDQAVDRVYEYVQAKLMEKMDISKSELEEFYINGRKPKRSK
jgi:hypothetical protein